MCGCQNKINGIGRKNSNKMAKKRKVTRRRRASVRDLNSKDITGIATSAVLGGAGAVVLGMILDKVVPAEQAQYNHYIKIAAGVALAAMTKNTYLQAAGLGAATVGAASVVADLTDGAAVTGMGLLRPGGASQYQLAGLEGRQGFGDKINIL